MIREELERLEEMILSPLAAKSSRSKGRVRPSEPCEIRTEFQRDRDKILHCKSFRRLKHKTQVLFLRKEIIIVPGSPIPWRYLRLPAPLLVPFASMKI
jgi:hypothetical protein